MKFVPATEVVGWVVATSFVAVPARIDTLAEVPGLKPLRAALNT